MRFTTQQIATTTHGRLVGPIVDVSGAGIDSRTIEAGQLFVPIKGGRDGHDFIDDAIGAGAVAYLTQRSTSATLAEAASVQVEDTVEALQALGRAARHRLGDLVVGVTGSVGKTTVKELLRGALSALGTVAASPASFNNELGVPLTLVNTTDHADGVVVEMGARGQGHITFLCGIAAPTVGVVTDVSGAHLELFETIDAVAMAKRELVEALPADGLAVLNADNPYVAAMAAASRARSILFGLDPKADVTATNIDIDQSLQARFRLHSPWGTAAVRLSVRGRHQVSNALAAAAVALARGVEPGAVAAGLEAVKSPASRMEVTRTRAGALLIDDSYNANPTSVLAGLRALADLDVDHRVAVLGVMAELGATGAQAHLDIATTARDLDVDVFAIGTELYGVKPVDISDVAAQLRAAGARTAILVKGSRVAGLERVVALLQ